MTQFNPYYMILTLPGYHVYLWSLNITGVEFAVQKKVLKWLKHMQNNQ